MMRDYLSLLRARPAFRLLWAAELVSLVGDWFTVVAVSLLTLGAGGRVVLLALSFVAHTLPQALLSPIAGPLADFVDRRRSLLATAVAECLLTMLMVVAASTSHVGLVPLLVLVRSVVGAMREPAASSALPRLVEPDELVRANALLSVTWSFTFAVGMAMGGLVAGYRPDLALGIDALSFAVAAAVLSALPSLEPDAAPEGEERGLQAVWKLLRGMRAAIRIALSDRDLARAVLGKAPVALAGGASWVLLNLVAREHAFAGSAGVTLGVLQALRGISTGVGPVVSERALGAGADRARVRIAVAIASFAGMGLFVFASAPWALVAAALLWGAGVGANWVLTTSEMQERGPRGFVGRLSALDGLAWSLATCAAALATAVAIERAGDPKIPTLVALALGAALYLALEVVTRRRRDAAAA